MNQVELHPEELEAKGRVVGVIFHFFVQRLARAVFGAYFRCYSRGRRNLPRKGGVIIAPTHRSNLDTPMIGASAGRPLRYFAKSGLFKGPITTWLLVTMGAFPVRRDTIDRSALKAALVVLDAGQPLVVFPEGERKSGTRIHPLLDGVAWLAAKAQVPVVPVAIGGTERAMGIGVRMPRPRTVRFVWGEPLAPPETDHRGRVRPRCPDPVFRGVAGDSPEHVRRGPTGAGHPRLGSPGTGLGPTAALSGWQ